MSTLLLILGAVLSGCSVGSRAVEAPAEYLSPAGWQNARIFLHNTNFTRYSKSVKDEVRRYRIAFDPARKDIEVELASPVELPLGKQCVEGAHGIAILVHGLSDTAFSMRDIGSVLADACYRSRIILLPGHGTRAGDLLTTRMPDWHDTLDYLIDQAATETDTIMLVGFSLGAVLTLDAALRRADVIDGIIGLSPAYYLSSAKIARWASLAAPVMHWVDRGVADDSMRYEAMPTRGVAETWSSMKQLHRNLSKAGSVSMPWMLAQSMDDAVVVPAQNEALWKRHAANPASRLIRFVSDQQHPEAENIMNLPARSNADRVIALTHLAIHQSPDNPHYGKNGRYRNCGGNMPRDADRVRQCEQAESVWYGLWRSEPVAGQAMAFSTFNPSFEQFADEIRQFTRQVSRAEIDRQD